MNAIEYLESKDVFMQPDKRRYKIIKRNGHEVYVLKSARIREQIMSLRFKKAVVITATVRQIFTDLIESMSGVKSK